MPSRLRSLFGLLVVCALLAGSVLPAAAPALVYTGAASPPLAVADEDDDFDAGSFFGTVSGALIGGTAAIFGSIKAAQMQEGAQRKRDKQRSDEEERERQAADIRRLVQLSTSAVAALPPVEESQSLSDAPPEALDRVEGDVIKAGGIQPFIVDQGVRRLAKDLLETMATIVSNDTLTPAVRRNLIATARERLRELQKEAGKAIEQLRQSDLAA